MSNFHISGKLQTSLVDDGANGRNKATSMASMTTILHGTMGNNMIFDILPRVSFLFDYFLLFLCHLAFQHFLMDSQFSALFFSFLCLNHDESVANLLRPPQRGSYTNGSTVASNFLAILCHLAGSGLGLLSCFQK